LSVTDKGIEILKSQTETNIESFHVFYDSISTEQRENFKRGVALLREVLPKPPECTEILVKKYISPTVEEYDDGFMAVMEDLSFFAFSILEKNAKEYSSVLLEQTDEFKALTEHQLQLIFCVSVMKINTISQLSGFLNSSNSTLSITISKLVEQGYLEKIYPEMGSDGRFVYINPTEKTLDMLEKTHILAEKHVRASFLNKLTTDELEKFIHGMDYFLKVFKNNKQNNVN
jgi:DNA-binding MarR family transcriptional regulator